VHFSTAARAAASLQVVSHPPIVTRREGRRELSRIRIQILLGLQ
jgi:hypothetical protein